MNESFLIIIGFILLLLIITITYISYKSFQNKRKPIAISPVKYALFEGQSQLPDGVNFVSNPNTNQIIKEISEINALESCQEGYCVIDLSTGIKRCPASKTSLLYNIEKERCVSANSCPSELPFAILSNGSTDKFGNCDVPRCRCVSDEICADNVIDIFEVIGGNPDTKQSQFLNYSFKETEKSGDNESNIIIPNELVGIQYCKLNPAFTERIQNGCVFDVFTGEPLDCADGSYPFLTNTAVTLIKVDNNKIFFNNRPPDSTTLYTQLLDFPYPFKQKGYLIYDNNNYSYNGNSLITAINGDTYIMFTNVQRNGIPGYIENIPNGSRVFLSTLTFSECSSQEVGSNDRNMLNCVQPQKQPCKTGQLTYNVDKGNPRQFAQLQTESQNKIKSLPRRDLENYLEDPSFYTVSCSLGNGCSDQIDKSLCTPITTVKIDSIQFPDVNTTSCNIFFSQNYEPQAGDVISLFNIFGFESFGITSSDINTFHTVKSASYVTSNKIINILLPNIVTKSGSFTPTYNSYMMQGKRTSLVEQDCSQAIQDKKNNFYSTLDISGVKNYWPLSNSSNNTGTGFFIEDQKLVVDEKNSLLIPESGDYWSLFSGQITTFGTSLVEAGTSTLYLNDIGYVSVGMSVSYFGTSTYTSTVYSRNPNTLTVNLTDNLQEGLSVGDKIIFTETHVGNKYGTISDVSQLGTSYHATLLPNSGTLGVDYFNNLSYYKAYGFNGINYNTYVDLTSGNRYYSDSSFWKSFSFETSNLTPPLSPLNVLNNDPDDKNLTFSDSDALFKKLRSMYYPVWNDDTFNQECVMPKPYLLAYPIVDESVINTNGISYAQIQFSGQHFGEYIWNRDGSYSYNTLSKLYPNSNYFTYQSSTEELILDEINPNISVGDKIVDSSGIFETYMVLDPPTQTFSFSGVSATFNVTIAEDHYNFDKNIVLEDKYNTFYFSGVSYRDSNSEITTTNGTIFTFTGSKSNYFLGKIYAGEWEGVSYNFSLVSDVNVTQIDDNFIQTDYAGINLMPTQNNLIQFVNTNENLELEFSYDFGQEDRGVTGIGSNATLRVSGITNQRITNLEITDNGINYLNDNRPLVKISKYKVSDPTDRNIFTS